MRRTLFLIVLAIMALPLFAQAPQSKFIEEQVAYINGIIGQNSTGSSDPKAEFSVDSNNRIIKLHFERSNEMPREQLESFVSAMPTAMPTGILSAAYQQEHKTADMLQFLKALVDNDYIMEVTLKGGSQEITYQITAKDLMSK